MHALHTHRTRTAHTHRTRTAHAYFSSLESSPLFSFLQVFLQLEAGTYQSAQSPVDLETLLRRIGGDELEVECCRSCDAANRVST